MRSLIRRIRGALGSALTWGLSWLGASLVLNSVVHLVWGFPLPSPWQYILYSAVNSGITGFLTGGAFSAYLGLAYRNRTILDIRVGRFALGGAIVAGLLSPVINLSAGLWARASGLPLLAALGPGIIWASLFGGVTAGAMIKLAQGASRQIASGSVSALEAEQAEALSLLGEESA